MRSNPITWKRFLDRSRADFASLREFVVSSYKDPVWIIASVAFVTVIPWEFSFWNGVPEKIANLQRTTQTQSDFVRHQALAIELQEGVLHSLEMESMASQYIHDKGILTHVSTPADAAQCLELVEKAHLEYVISSAAVSAVEFHERVLTDFQSALRDDLKCMETELQKIKTLCKNKDQAKLNPVQAELFSNSLRCLKASEVQKESLEADFKATFKESSAELDVERIRVSILKVDMLFAALGVLYIFGYLQAIIWGWQRIQRRALATKIGARV